MSWVHFMAKTEEKGQISVSRPERGLGGSESPCAFVMSSESKLPEDMAL